jgi:hypothetical protein
MLIDKLGDVVDLVVDDEVQVFLGVVAGDLLEGEFLRHGGGGSLMGLVGVTRHGGRGTERCVLRGGQWSVEEREEGEEK